ncbi:MAG: hypothetical protein M0P39_06785 [Rhodocyclaceae bacterium]|nr:hypothetical protein [Rhodocyclaceae bacterium]
MKTKQLVALCLMVVSAGAYAALPAAATTAFTDLSADVTAMLALVWGVVFIATGGWVSIRLFKKGANKAV